MKDFSIRNFRKSDIDDLLDLLLNCFSKEFEVTGFDPERARGMANRAFGNTGRLVRGMLRLLGKEPMKFYVAEADGKVIGTTMVINKGKVAQIATVMVHPDYRRKGIAKRLVKKAIDYAQRKGMLRAVLDADSKNAHAIDLYAKLGFTRFEETAYYVGDTKSLALARNAIDVTIRPFEKDDLNEVYKLVVTSEDPNHTGIYDFSKKNLRTPLLQRLLGFSTQKKMVAVLDGKLVGYTQISYTTVKEAGSISSINVDPSYKSRGCERALISSAVSEIDQAGVTRIRVLTSTAKQEIIEALKDFGFREALTLNGMFIEL